jgi:hypothetical protein
MGVSYKIIPMFYVTPDHPLWLTSYAPKIIFFLLLTWTLIFPTYIFEKFIWLQNFIPFIKLGISIVVICYSLETIKRLKKRKRPIIDTTIIYWQLSMIFFSLGAVLYSSSQFMVDDEKLSFFASASFGIGLLSLITGMLYKIIPFLTWLHLTTKGMLAVPTVRELLPDRLARKQFYLHLSMIVFFIINVFFPIFKFLFSFLMGCSLIATLFLFLQPLKIYHRHLKKVRPNM